MDVNEKARKLLWQEVEGIDNELLNEKTADDQWSIRQVLEHLYRIESTFTKLIKKQLESGENVFAKDQPIELTVDRSYKVDAPEFAVPGNEYKTLVELKDLLNNSHKQFKTIIQDADPTQLEAKGIPHPAFGHLNLKQAVEFVGYHELRHIEQIKEVKNDLGIMTKN